MSGVLLKASGAGTRAVLHAASIDAAADGLRPHFASVMVNESRDAVLAGPEHAPCRNVYLWSPLAGTLAERLRCLR